MAWGSKRSRDWTYCEQCGDGFDMENDEWCTCCYCEGTLCETCMRELTCKGCSEAQDRGELVIGTQVCESCVESCDTCGDEWEPALYCTGCMKEHRETCTAKTHAEKVMATAGNVILEAERELTQAQLALDLAQDRVKTCEAELSKARRKKADAEAELAAPDAGAADAAPSASAAASSSNEAGAAASTGG